MANIKLTEYSDFSRLFKACKKLQEIALDYFVTSYYSSAYCQVDEYLYHAPAGIEYSIDGYNDYISFEKIEHENLLSWIENLQHDFAVFSDTVYNLIKDRLERYAPVLSDYYRGYIELKEKDLQFLETETQKAVHAAEKELCELCTSCYTQYEDIEYLCECADEMEIFDNYYIDTDTGEIYEHRDNLKIDQYRE